MRAAPWLGFLVVLAACVSTNAALLDPSVKYQKICPDGAERQGAAVAIYIPADSDRVRQACGLAPKESQIASSRALIRGGGAPHPFQAASSSFIATAADRTPAPPSPPLPAPDPAASGYASYPASGPEAAVQSQASVAAVQPDAPAPTEIQGNAGRSKGELRRSTTLRRALDDVARVGIVADFQEVRAGFLRLDLGKGFATGSSVDYNLNRLRLAYSESLNLPTRCILELWDQGQKVGEYTENGMLLGPEYSTPR
jgi:hypothetical protein